MEKSSKRGKIPQTDWPLIMTRYEAGETLASIARTYDCSPPAISYIVSRNREHPANEGIAQPAAEPHLIKAPATGAAGDGGRENQPEVAAPEPAPLAESRREPIAEARPAAAMNGDPRRKLHLSLGNGGNGSHAPANGGNGHADAFAASARSPQPGFALPRPAPSQGAGERAPQQPFQGPPRTDRDFAAADGKPAQQPRDADAPRRDNGSFIDRELRSRVDGDIAAFLAAFDAALAEDNQANRFGLREATDRLLRAGARTRIELERMEAKLPLPPRDGGARPEQAAWRYR